ncbi:MAG TPA: NAD(P)H-dependent oxidoreductase [Pseudosphingobacterium sp.]|nr:NAD(P)H-dependent oxidoreductase [Pseudosphingobacterium sp.]
MKKILHVISSPKGNDSYSVKLGKTIIDKLIAKFPDSIVMERVLVNDDLPALNESHINAFFKPIEQREPADYETLSYSDVLLEEVCTADFLVIGAPMYNFGIHSSLKAWIDLIVRVGITFKYNEDGRIGLLTDKTAYLAAASGSVYSDGPMQTLDFVVPYLKAILEFMGISNIHVFRMEGTARPTFQSQDYPKVIAAIEL